MSFTPPPAAPPDAVAQPSRRTDPQETFDVKTDAYLTWQTAFRNWVAGFRTWCITMLAEMTQATAQVEQSRLAVVQSVQDASGSATAAGQAAGQAVPAAAAAAASALQMDKRYLGAKAVLPATDNQGAALQAGAVCLFTGANPSKVMTWDGAGWVTGIAAVAGVNSINGKQGDVALAYADLQAKPTTLAAAGITDAAPKASPTLTGPITLNGSVRATKQTLAALAVDCALGNYFAKTIGANSTITFANVPAADAAYAFRLDVVHSAGVITWPAAVKWPGNVAPPLTTGRTHMFFFSTTDGGATWRGAVLSNYTA
ncbi:pyocin knob domain-containing protein [Acidovorax sp. SUPP2522]|uniref:hypothetical protein n=1 Tax=unclassified Acidovorax TaxID=2684926 RepID=UPI0023495186|nr:MULTISPECIES: hypothetical protein [unclassified Acidovorax]WCM99988.1 hypothetical protein M5C96_11635 [Acidovorax sp. GBBC 1281]GKT18546.1 pyocin knob domain-containing protein [Acidovorax sp. SUPP2522]